MSNCSIDYLDCNEYYIINVTPVYIKGTNQKVFLENKVLLNKIANCAFN